MLSMKLCFLLICVLIKLSHGTELEGQAHAGEGQLLPSVCRKDANGSMLSVEIRLPFMDMELRHERRVHVLSEEQQQLLLVLHGSDLFQLQLSSQDKRLVRLGVLAGRVGQQEALAAAVISWREYLLLAVALEDSMEIYQLQQHALLHSNQLQFEPIQQLTLPGKLQHLHLLKPTQQQVLLLLAAQYTQTQHKLKTLEWLDSYFNPVEELTVPAIKAFQVLAQQPIYVITGRSLRGQSKLVLSIYELETPTLRLQRRQSLTLQSKQIHSAHFRGRNWLLACGSNSSSSPSNCILFRMVEGNFVVYRKHVLRQLQFAHLLATNRGQLLIGARQNGEVLVFNSHRLDCYSGFGVGTVAPSGLFSMRNPLNETFVVLSYVSSEGDMMLRMVQLAGVLDTNTLSASSERNDDLSSVQLHRHEFEEQINALRSLLLQHKKLIAEVRPLLQFDMEQPLHMRVGGRIDHVHVQSHHLQSPTQLQQRVAQLREQLLPRTRTRRAFGAGNAQDTLKVKRLHVQNLVYAEPLLPGHSLDSSQTPAILSVKLPLLTKTLQTPELLTPENYKGASGSSTAAPPPPLQSEHNLVVHNLHVERINNISWFDFYDSLYLRSRDHDYRIEGRLIVQSKARVVNLETQLLNGLVVRQLFNLRQPQVVQSNLYMSAFYATEVQAKLVNGLDFAKDIVYRGDNDTLIETPVSIKQLSVSGDLLVANETKWARQLTVEPSERHNMLQQYYTGTVTITGSLTVNNLRRDTQETLLQLLSGINLNKTELATKYLLREAPQNLSQLSFGNARVSMPQLKSEHINQHATLQHLLSGGNATSATATSEKALHIIFMNASIEGNVYCSNYSSKLAQLAGDAVRQGEVATIRSHKRFEAPLQLQALATAQLNGCNISELLLKSEQDANFTGGDKSFGNIVVQQGLQVQQQLQLQQLNELPLAQLATHAQSVQRLELPQMPQLQSLQMQRLNGLQFDVLLSQQNAQLQLQQKQLIIEGNVRFEQPLQLQQLNQLQWTAYVQQLVMSRAPPAAIKGRKRFLQPVQLSSDLQTRHINGVDVAALLLQNTLLRGMPQSIGGNYSFQRLQLSNLDVPSINGMRAADFVDTRQSALQLQGAWHLQQLQLNGSLSCGLKLPQPQTQLERQQRWRKLIVLGDALHAPATPTELHYLQQHAVRRRGAAQAISAHVRLQGAQLGVLQSVRSFNKRLNLSHIAADALLRYAPAEQQVWTPLQLQAPVSAVSLRAPARSQFGSLNGIDLQRLNDSLYRLSSGAPIAAKLQFQQPLLVRQLRLQGQLNGKPIDGIFEPTLAASAWPAVRLHKQQLFVSQALQLAELNGMHLDYLLQQRVPLRGAPLELYGQLSFEQLQLGAQTLLRSINNITLQQVLYKRATQLQAVAGAKTFQGGIRLRSPAHIMRLNGKDLSESYMQSIFTNRNYNIDSLLLDAAAFEAGMLQAPLLAATALQLQRLETQLQQQQRSQRLLYLEFDATSYQLMPHALPHANLQLNQTLMLLPPRSSCERHELQAQLSYATQRVHLRNVSLPQQRQRLQLQRDFIRIKAQNYCQAQRFRSRIKLSCRAATHTLGLRQHVQSLQLPQFGNYSLLLISTPHEVRVLHVTHSNCSLRDWQSLRPAAGRLMQLLPLDDDNRTTLLLTSGLLAHLPVVTVHRLNPQTQRFELLQHIEGDYDLAVWQPQLQPQPQLLLSCLQCQHITVLAFDAATQQFTHLQQLRLQARIQQLLPFGVQQVPHLLVLSTPSSENFYLLNYAPPQGWQQLSFGFKAELQWSWPLIAPGAQLNNSTDVLLLCGEEHCRLVKALLD
ncbi:uncharacterized protein LOC108605055 [Drosophila busckii]|uniref:uncharacterized protein LOC108605055 n=1 Tax=Drosophila busckii TaxID=30019 RepID=UPI00083F2A39|nr:uncharacterized protein LOC108605055 [Drosophila busckii]